ncbi:hypothetical protein VTK73DRAFT_7439 [Phialemonium thermophilum]|uniref:Uncharacterized protein n=1 Tax=Phialemonium thermophilum TaxID=223376 RepID=A0ABR3WEV4_9PEZI
MGGRCSRCLCLARQNKFRPDVGLAGTTKVYDTSSGNYATYVRHTGVRHTDQARTAQKNETWTQSILSLVGAVVSSTSSLRIWKAVDLTAALFCTMTTVCSLGVFEPGLSRVSLLCYAEGWRPKLQRSDDPDASNPTTVSIVDALGCPSTSRLAVDRAQYRRR